jgi:hypothetical protein
MIVRLAFVFAAAVLLAGCTDADWDHAFAYAGFGGDQAKPAQADTAQADVAQANAPQPTAPQPNAPPPNAATPPQTQAVAAAPDDWCAEVARAAATEAADQGFDRQTQKNRAQTAFQQCAHQPAAVQ